MLIMEQIQYTQMLYVLYTFSTMSICTVKRMLIKFSKMSRCWYSVRCGYVNTSYVTVWLLTCLSCHGMVNEVACILYQTFLSHHIVDEKGCVCTIWWVDFIRIYFVTSWWHSHGFQTQLTISTWLLVVGCYTSQRNFDVPDKRKYII